MSSTSTKGGSGTFTGKTTGTGGSTSATESEQQQQQKKNYDKLLAKLNSRGISLLEFAVAEEKRKKKMLQDDYQDIKNDAGWLYDEPMELPADLIAKEKELQKAKLEAASKVK